MSEKQKDKTPGLFVREATGLVKKVSLLDTISINIADLSVGSAIGIVGFTMVLLPSVSGVNLVYGSIIAWLLTVPQVIVYTMMSRRIARTGGDYVWMSRSLGGFIGTVMSFVGPVINVFAYLAIISLATIFTLGSVGLSLGNHSFLGLALPGNVPGSDPLLQFIIATVIFSLLIAANIVRPSLGFKLISAFIVVGIIALVLADLVILSAGTQGVVGYMDFLNSIGANATYSSVASSYSGPTFDLGATLSILPFFAIFIYPFVNASPAIASEIKSKSAKDWAVPIASIVTLLFATSSFAVMYYVGGFEFTNAALSNPKLVFDYSFNFWTLAMGVAPNTVVSGLIGVGWILWNLSILGFGIILFSRYAVAMAFDRFLPKPLAYVSPRFGSPVTAHVIDLVVTVALVGLTAFFYGPLSSLGSAIVASMFFFVFVGLGAAAYGAKHDKGRARAALVIFGILDAIVFLYVAATFFIYPTVYGGNALSYGYVVATLILGAVIYFAAKRYHAKKGIDINMVYKEIPPE